MRDHIALVAGGAGGIGRRVAFALAQRRASVILCGRSQANLEEAKAALLKLVPAASIATEICDLQDYPACQALVQGLERRHRRLDAVVNCANTGVAGMGGRFESVDPSCFQAMLHASLGSLFNLCHSVLPLLKQTGGGSLVAFAADSGRFAAPNQTMIGATRAAIMMFCRSLALEVAAEKIRVNCVSASYVRDTPVFDYVMQSQLASRAETAARRAGLGLPGPDDLAELATFLVSPGSAHLTGQVISVNGGVSA